MRTGNKIRHLLDITVPFHFFLKSFQISFEGPLVYRNKMASLTNLWVKIENWGSSLTNAVMVEGVKENPVVISINLTIFLQFMIYV